MGWPFFPRNMTGPSPSPKKSGQNRAPKKHPPTSLRGGNEVYYFFNSVRKEKKGGNKTIYMIFLSSSQFFGTVHVPDAEFCWICWWLKSWVHSPRPCLPQSVPLHPRPLVPAVSGVRCGKPRWLLNGWISLSINSRIRILEKNKVGLKFGCSDFDCESWKNKLI